MTFKEFLDFPLVSIVIPCWNGERYVEDAIVSCLSQTYISKEVIVIDDGSTDKTLDIIKSFGDRVRYRTGSNKGGCSARNLGIDLAKGEFVQFLDADDVLFPEKLAKQVKIASNTPGAITYTDYRRRSGKKLKEVTQCSLPVVCRDPFVFVLRHAGLTVTAPLYRKSWLQAVGGFNETLPRSQDFELNLRLAAHLARERYTFLHIPEALFEVRRRPSSVSSNPARTFATKVQYLQDIVTELENRNEFTLYRSAELAMYTAGVGRQCIRGGEVNAGKALIELAESWNRIATKNQWGRGAWFVKSICGPVVVEHLGRLRRRWPV